MRGALALAVLAAAGTAATAAAVEIRSPDGELYAFPTLLDEHGDPLATSTLAQWVERARLHVRITHAFPDGRRAVERARFARGNELVQELWSWEERRGRRLVRAFEVDLVEGRARGRKLDGEDEKRWDEEVKIERGRTFVGLGLPYALKNLRDALVNGEEVRLRGIVFLPKPASVPLEVKHAGRERISLAGRRIDADRFEIRPDLKGLEKLIELVKGPMGADVWLHHGTPPMILRIRYPMVEVNDAEVVMETLGAPRAPKGERAAPRGR